MNFEYDLIFGNITELCYGWEYSVTSLGCSTQTTTLAKLNHFISAFQSLCATSQCYKVLVVCICESRLNDTINVTFQWPHREREHLQGCMEDFFIAQVLRW